MQKVLNILPKSGKLSGKTAVVRLIKIRQQLLRGLLRASLQNVVDGFYVLGPVLQQKNRRVSLFQIGRNTLADVQPAANLFEVVHK